MEKNHCKFSAFPDAHRPSSPYPSSVEELDADNPLSHSIDVRRNFLPPLHSPPPPRPLEPYGAVVSLANQASAGLTHFQG